MKKCYACGGRVDHYEDGGEVASNEDPMKTASKSIRKAFGSSKYAHGGEVDAEHEDEMLMHEEMEDDMHDNDVVKRIMKHRMKHMSKGGRVANEDGPIADSEPAEYDDLVKDDDLEFKYTGKNSGDELGDEQEDEDRKDVVKRIMKSRMKKDRMPHPA